MKRYRKSTLDRIIDDNYTAGFLAAIYGVELRMANALEYASTSGWYQYNGVRRIATTYGWQAGEKVIANRGAKRFVLAPKTIKPTPECVAEAYAAVREMP